MADRGTIHTSVPLSNVAAGFKAAQSIWMEVLKPIPVDKEDGKYYEFGQDWMRYYGIKRADKTKSQRVNSYNATQKSYSCNEHTYNDIVSAREIDEADVIIKPKMRVTKNLSKIVDMDVEVDAATIVFTAANYGTQTSTPAAKWNTDVAAGVPITDVDKAKTVLIKNIGTDQNLVMVVGQEVHDQLKRHPDLIELYKYTQKGILTEELLAVIFGVKKYVVGKKVYINTQKGQTVTKTYVWGKDCAIIYVPTDAAKEEPAFGYTFMHKLFGGMTAMVQDIPVPLLALRGRQIEVSKSYIQKVTGIGGGYLLKNVVN